MPVLLGNLMHEGGDRTLALLGWNDVEVMSQLKGKWG